MQNRKKKKKDQNSLLHSVGEGEGGMFQENSIETCILSRVEQITSPGWMHETSAQTWCNRKTQRERVEREVGGVIGMGNTCKPMAVSFQCMTKSTTKKKKRKKNKVTGLGSSRRNILNGNVTIYSFQQLTDKILKDLSNTSNKISKKIQKTSVTSFFFEALK